MKSVVNFCKFYSESNYECSTDFCWSEFKLSLGYNAKVLLLDCYKKCYYDNKWLSIPKDQVKQFLLDDSEFNVQNKDNEEIINYNMDKLEKTNEFKVLVNK